MASRSKPRVLITAETPDHIKEDAVKPLKEVADIDIVDSSTYSKKQELLKVIGDYEAAIIASNIPFDQEVITKAKKLKIISRLGVGYDLVDVKAASDRGIIVTYTPVLSETVVDTVFSLLFAVAKNISKADAYVKNGKWKRREDRKKFTGTDVFGKNLGIIGLGRIGTILARRAKCFDMPILYYDVVRYRELEEELDLRFLPLHDLLAQADFISIHTPLTENTRGLIGEKELKTMKKNAILINTSRGPVIDEKALTKALKGEWIAGAGLDVYEREPLDPDNPLLKLDNVVLTPHIGGGTEECQQRIVNAAVDNTVRVLKGEKPLYPVTP